MKIYPAKGKVVKVVPILERRPGETAGAALR
jgi:hypothetical protein